MKTLIVMIALCITSTAGAETWDEQAMRAESAKAAMRKACPPKYIETWRDAEQRKACEDNFKLKYYDLSHSEEREDLRREVDSLRGQMYSRGRE